MIRTVYALAIVLLLAFASCSRAHKGDAKSGQPILKAIYTCKNETGRCPGRLSDLYPKCLGSAPLEDWRRGWHYSSRHLEGNSNSFILSRFSIGYKTRVEYIEDGATSGLRVNEEGHKTQFDLPSVKGLAGDSAAPVIKK